MFGSFLSTRWPVLIIKYIHIFFWYQVPYIHSFQSGEIQSVDCCAITWIIPRLFERGGPLSPSARLPLSVLNCSPAADSLLIRSD